MCKPGPVPPLRSIPLHLYIAKNQGRRFLITKCLVIVAACLATALVAFIVLEAFDSDLDLWPSGSENFTLAAQDPPVTGGAPVGGFVALNVMQCFVITAGAHLVLRHRARSALATDSPILFSPLNMAEPRVPFFSAAPALGHFFCSAQGDNRNVSAMARPTHLGPLSCAFRCA